MSTTPRSQNDAGETTGGAKVLRFPGRTQPSVLPGEDHPSEGRLRDVIGDVLREERLRQERTLVDVAEEAAVSVPYLSEVERGRKEVSSDLLAAIHTSLGLELSDVLERATERLTIDVPSISGIRSSGMQRGGRTLMLAA